MDNLFEVTMGRRSLRWDAIWRVVSWLLTPDEGHGCGSSILRPFSEFAFGEAAAECWLRCEYRLQHLHPQNGKEKWPDLVALIPSRESTKFVAIMDDVALPRQRAVEKFENLKTYYALGKREFPSAEVRVIVVTNTNDPIRIRKSCDVLDQGLPAAVCPDWWIALPLGTLGDWVSNALSVEPPPSTKNALLLQDFVSWTKSLSS
ncbi:hypothetical protein ACVIW0_002127 [Bradyrhizobium sp. USDA 4454]